MPGFDLIGRLFARTADRDGRFHAVEPDIPAALAAATHPRLPTEPELALQQAIGTKLLHGWLANRQQILLPHTLNFRVLTPEQSDLLIAIMAAAAQADGRVDDEEARQLPPALQRAGAGDAETRSLERAIRNPQPLLALMEKVQEAGLASHAYAVALLAINRRGQVNRAFLDYLAVRLGLDRDLTASLERRYRA